MPSAPSMTAIVAATLTNGIGLNGTLPWRLPGEMKYFARGEDASHSNAVIMGRKTWDGIPPKFRPLKSRHNVVISRNGVDVTDCPNTTAHSSVSSALTSLPASIHRIFLIGGSQLYSLALTPPSLVDRVLLTRIIDEFSCDTFLDDFTSRKEWHRSTHAELCEWVGWAVPEGEVEEKGVRYRYEMWVLRT
ncbi:dihydrofolate reductase, partial [Tremellales sp. Uapishka_1]